MQNDVRLIDANAMRDEWLENGENEYVYDTNAVLASIDEQPTIDAVPVVHGRWEYSFGSYSTPKCSCCGWNIPYSEDSRLDARNFCPNCGAKMDGGTEE